MYEYDVSKSNMWREVHEQPEIIRHVIDVNLPIIENICKEVDNRNISKVLLVGRGSSEHALLVGKYAFEVYTDKLTSMAYPSTVTLLDGKVDLSDVLTIGVSQCGEAKDVYTVLERCQNQGGIAVSVTNEHECLMRNVGNYYINCECGKETSFTAAKSYMSQAVITLLFAAVLSHDEKVLEQIKKAPDIIEQSLCKNIEEQVKKSIPLFRNVQDILLLGRGFSYAVANETELKIMEASYTNAKAYSSCDYPHGPIATTKRFIPVIFFLTDEKTNDSTIKLVEKIKKDFSVSTLVVTNNEKYIAMANEAVLLPKEAEGVAGVFGMAVFSQLFACLLSLARGYNPDEPNALIAGLMTVVLAYKSGVSAETALGLSLPFALLMQWIVIACQSLFSGFNVKVEQAIKQNDIKKFKFYVFLPEIILTSLYAVVAFLSTYALQNVLSKFVNSFPEFVSHGFEIAGGLLPGLGLALLLKVMVKKENVPYLIIGFLVMSIMKPDNVLPVALFAIALVLIDFMRDKEAKTTSVVTGGEDDGEGI